MTVKEMKLVKQLGYTTFAVYSYIKSNTQFSNKELKYDLGISEQSRYRSLKALKSMNIITIHGTTNDREIELLGENAWKLS